MRYDRRTLDELEKLWAAPGLQEMALEILDALEKQPVIVGQGLSIKDWRMATNVLFELVTGIQTGAFYQTANQTTYGRIMEALRYLEYCDLVSLMRNDPSKGSSQSNYITRIELIR